MTIWLSKGIHWARRDSDPRRRRIITSAVEHHAVLDAIEWLVHHEGAEVTFLPTEPDGSVTPSALRDVLQGNGLRDSGDVALVSVMWANNEVGTIMPVAVGGGRRGIRRPYAHSDAIQAVGHIPVDFGASGLSAMSIAAHKFGGPTGVGALLLRREAACVPLAHGGGQERDVRSGTPDVAGVVAMAAAVDIAVSSWMQTALALTALRDRLIAGVVGAIDDASVNGAQGEHRLPETPTSLFGAARGIRC